MRILLTGCAGTWGQEFTKQLLAEGHEVIGVDRDEKGVADFKRQFKDMKVVVDEFDNYDFNNYGGKIDLLIHLAAYKHIDLCEVNVLSAIENNVIRTMRLYEKAAHAKAKILYISTDKSVEPYSAYSQTKALGEKLTWYYGGKVARSGNIIGSRGSVLNIWEECIQNDKPLKVTDMAMERYFIKIEDAVATAWEGYKKGNRLTVVDIGGHQRIRDIIVGLLNKYGKSIDTYPIEIIGKRPGERLVDNIMWEFEKEEL